MTTDMLRIRDLELRLGDFRLGPVSLGLGAGDYLVLLGPSGCGKTTLLRAIAGYYRAPAGTIALGGSDVSSLPPHKRGIGYVAQAVDLFPHLDVAANVAFGLGYMGMSREDREGQLRRTVDLLGIGHLLGRSPGELSGGESKRAALARSLVVGPRVLLLDEPLSMLDHNARLGMLRTLRMIHQELGTATIHVTHDREEAWTLAEELPGAGEDASATRCAVMRDGRVEQVGRVEDLFRRPRTRFVAEFLGGANVFPARFEGAEAVLAWGRLPLAGQPDFERGYAQIRPEALAPCAEGNEAAVTGMVRAAADRGAYRELIVTVADGVDLKVHAPAGRPAPPTGGRVSLRCLEPAHAIPEDGDA